VPHPAADDEDVDAVHQEVRSVGMPEGVERACAGISFPYFHIPQDSSKSVLYNSFTAMRYAMSAVSFGDPNLSKYSPRSNFSSSKGRFFFSSPLSLILIL